MPEKKTHVLLLVAVAVTALVIACAVIVPVSLLVVRHNEHKKVETARYELFTKCPKGYPRSIRSTPPPAAPPSGAETYDFVIVGGGNSGLVVATRLTEDPSVKVLVLEAGPDLFDNFTEVSTLWQNMFGVDYCVPNVTAPTCGPATFPLHVSKTPFMVPYMGFTDATWHYNIVPSPTVNWKRLVYPRGTGVGGSTAANYMAAVRGLAKDYDGWNLNGWAYKDVLPYFKKMEHQYGRSDADYHGYDGPICMTNATQFANFSGWTAWQDAAIKAGYTQTDDFWNPSSAYGVGPVQQMVCPTGERSSAYDYLRQAMAQNDRVCVDKPASECGATQNLHLRTRKFVTKILFDTSGASPRATGVHYVDAFKYQFRAKTYHPDFDQMTPEGVKSRVPFDYFNDSRRPVELNCPIGGSMGKDNTKWSPPPDTAIDPADVVSVYATKEVIVSAGAFTSPHLLMLSGIGPAEELAQHNIPVIADLPVGKQLYDHDEVSPVWQYPDGFTPPWNPATDAFPLIGEWLSGKGGAFAANHVPGGIDFNMDGPAGAEKGAEIHALWLAFYFQSLDFSQYDLSGDPNVQLPRSIPEFFTWKGLQYYSFVIAIAHNCNPGSVKLHSADPLAPPLVDLALFGCRRTVENFLFAIKELRKINDLQEEPYKGIEIFPGPDVQSDADLENWIRTRSWSHQACCTVPMGNCTDTKAVADERGRVYKVSGLRIADISAMPQIPLGNPAVSTYMVAEKISQHIKEDYQLK